MQLTASDWLGASCLRNFANVSGVLSVQDTLIIIDIDAEIRGIVVAESDEVIEKNAAASLDLTVYAKAVFWLLSFGLIAVWVIYAVQPFFLAALTVIPRWVWPLFGGLVLLLMSRWWRAVHWRISFLLCCLFCLVTLEEPRSLLRQFLPVTSPGPGSSRLCVLSVNCSSSGDVIEDLLVHSPDLILIQESPSLEQLEHWGRKLWGGQFGVAVGKDCSLLARGRLVESQVDRQGNFISATWQPDAANRIQVCSLRLWPQPIRLDFWSRDYWNSYALVKHRQINQMDQLCTQIASASGHIPLIVGGDFNSPAGDSTEMGLQGLGLREAFAIAGRGWGKTITGDFPFHRIDRLWTSCELGVVSVTAHRSRHTDHRLVKCLLDLE